MSPPERVEAKQDVGCVIGTSAADLRWGRVLAPGMWGICVGGGYIVWQECLGDRETGQETKL